MDEEHWEGKLQGCYFIKIGQGFPDDMTLETGPGRGEGRLCDYLEMSAPQNEGQVQRP